MTGYNKPSLDQAPHIAGGILGLWTALLHWARLFFQIFRAAYFVRVSKNCSLMMSCRLKCCVTPVLCYADSLRY